jgi:hypothetical protein
MSELRLVGRRPPKPPLHSTLNHVAVQRPGGDDWCVGYQRHGTNVVILMNDGGMSEFDAKEMARQLNAPRSHPRIERWRPEEAAYDPRPY